jgi:hypothetical protein
MALRYTKVGAELYVLPIGTHTLNGSAQNIHVVNFTTFGQIQKAALVIADADLSGALTVNVRGNTAADGSGTDTTIYSMALGIADNQELVVEVDAELLGHFEDRNGGTGTFKSLVFEVTGTNTDTMDAAVVIKGTHQYENLTPSDATTAS